jgi:hypothetical protein
VSGEPVEDDPTPVAEAGVGEEPPRPEEPPAQIAEEILTEFRTLMDAGVRDDLFEWVLAAGEHGERILGPSLPGEPEEPEPDLLTA